jgi:hypothetical protein
MSLGVYLTEKTKFPDVFYSLSVHLNVHIYAHECVLFMCYAHKCVTAYDLPCDVTHIYFFYTCERNHNDYIDVNLFYAMCVS